MSVETKTTVSDYINAMFKMADNMEQPCEQDERRKVLAAANELKEAWERERAEIAAKAAAEAVMLTNEKWKRDGGNAVMLRMALEKLHMHFMCDVTLLNGRFTPLFAIINHALASPPRNCDVGSVDEQKARMADWCHRTHCSNCPYCTKWCALSWANAPYETAQEGGDHADD